MLLPVSFVGVVIFVALVDLEAFQVESAHRDCRLYLLPCPYFPRLNTAFFVQGGENSLRFSPDEIVLFRFHPQKVDGISMRDGDHLDSVEWLQKGDAVRTIAEVNVPIYSNDSVL